MEGFTVFSVLGWRRTPAGWFGLLLLVLYCAANSRAQNEAAGILRDARLPASVKERIYRELSSEPGESSVVERSILEASKVKIIELGPNGDRGIRVWGASGICGATGNCPIWIFDHQTGELLLSASGFDLRVESVIHHARYDILARANMSAGDGVRDLYQFDGHKYQNVQETKETYR
jgi:hypothetical protein